MVFSPLHSRHLTTHGEELNANAKNEAVKFVPNRTSVDLEITFDAAGKRVHQVNGAAASSNRCQVRYLVNIGDDDHWS